MSDDEKLSFLDEKPRDEQGRFAPKSEPVQETAPPPEPTETLPPPAVTPGPVAPDAQTTDQQRNNDPAWAIAKALDERDKRQQLKAENDQLRRQLEEATRKPVEPIDPVIDPEGYERNITERIEQAKWDAKTETSLAFAVRDHGLEKVNAAKAWVEQKLASNPAFWLEIQRQADPYDFVVKQHKREMSYAKLGDDDPETWFEKRARELGYVRPGEPTPAPVAGPIPQQGTPPPRPSLASAPSAGGNAHKGPMGPGAAFDGAFKS